MSGVSFGWHHPSLSNPISDLATTPAAPDEVVPARISQLTQGKVLSTGTSLLIWQIATALSGILAARALGPAGKGIVAAALVWPQLIAWVLLVGLSTASSVRASESSGALNHLLGNAVVYSIGVGTMGAIAGVLLLPNVIGHLGDGAAEAARFAAVVIPLVMLSEIVAGINLGLGRTRHYNASRVMSGLLVLISTGALILVGAATPESFTLAGCLMGIAGLAVGAHGLPWRRVAVAVGALRSDIAYGLRVFLTSILAAVNLRLDVMVMSAFLGAEQIGFYSIATSAMLPIALVYTTGLTLILPSIAKARGARGGESQDDVRLVRRTAGRYTVITVAIAVVVAAALPIAVPLIFGAAFEPAVELAWILVPGYVATGYATIIDAGLVGMRKPWVGNLSQGAAVIVTVSLLPFAIPAYEAMGAAAVSTAAYIVAAAVSVWGARRVARSGAGAVATLALPECRDGSMHDDAAPSRPPAGV